MGITVTWKVWSILKMINIETMEYKLVAPPMVKMVAAACNYCSL